MKKQHREGFEVMGEKGKEVLKKCYAQLKEWDLTMPDDDPLMLHFGLDNFFEIGETEFWICNHTNEGYCGKYIFLLDEQRCPEHCHNMKHETFNVVKGSIIMTINGKDQTLKQGDILTMPVKAQHTFIATNGPALLLEVSKPCIYSDNYFSDKNITIF